MVFLFFFVILSMCSINQWVSIMLELKQTNGRASLYRKESYNGRTTAMVEWIVKVGDQVIRYCTTKKEAMIWLDLYKN